MFPQLFSSYATSLNLTFVPALTIYYLLLFLFLLAASSALTCNCLFLKSMNFFQYASSSSPSSTRADSTFDPAIMISPEFNFSANCLISSQGFENLNAPSLCPRE
uniref:Uncharacterized protein n=1 Tax=Thalassionema nitzschioides TaxID=33649 RepID=A0A7S1E7L4_9STRA